MSPVAAVYDRRFNCKLTIFGGHRPPLQLGKAMLALGVLLAVFALPPATVLAQQDKASQSQNQQDQNPPAAAQPKKDDDRRLTSDPGGKALGMSILGNQEAPKALIIVPWKRSELGNVQGISTLLDDSKQPIDKEVFMRMLSYYEIRSETARPAGTPAKTDAAQPNTAAQSPGVGGPARSEEAAKAAYRTDLDGGPDANRRRKQ